MGEVYRARDTRLDRTVAVKVLPASLCADADVRARFEREARAASSLNHPNICAVRGGVQPRWRADGRELYYVARDGMLMAVAVQTGPELDPGAPAPLFPVRLFEDFWYYGGAAVTASGSWSTRC